MNSAGHSTRIVRGAAFPMLAVVSACTWSVIDALVPIPLEAGPLVAGDASSPEAAPNDAAVDVTATAIEEVAADAPNDVDLGDGDSAASTEASVDSGPCNNQGTVARPWTFDSTTQGWSALKDANVQTAVTWTGATGNPQPGALVLDMAAPPIDAGGASGVWLEYAMPLGNLAGRTVSAWVWLESGPSPQLKMFVQTGSQYAWGDNGILTLVPHTWTCVSLPVSTPAYNNAYYDPTKVIVLGFEMRAKAAYRILVDSVRY